MSTDSHDRTRPALRLVPAAGPTPTAGPTPAAGATRVASTTPTAGPTPAAGTTRAVYNDIEDRYLSPAALQAMITDAAATSARGERAEMTRAQAAELPRVQAAELTRAQVKPAEPTTEQPAAPRATRTRPMKLVDLEGVPQATWRLVPEVVYVWQQRRWKLENIGCVMCVQDEAPGRTLATIDGGAECFRCTEDGELDEIPYSLKKVYTIQIGGIEQVLAVAGRISLEALAATLLRPEVFGHPPSMPVLEALCRALPDTALEGEVLVDRRPRRVEDVFSPEELRLVRCFRRRGPVLSSQDAVRAFEASGGNTQTASVLLSRSAVVQRVSDLGYALVGTASITADERRALTAARAERRGWGRAASPCPAA